MSASTASGTSTQVDLWCRASSGHQAKPNGAFVAGIVAGTTGHAVQRKTACIDSGAPIPRRMLHCHQRPSWTGPHTFLAEGTGPIAEVDLRSIGHAADDDAVWTGHDAVATSVAKARKIRLRSGGAHRPGGHFIYTAPQKTPSAWIARLPGFHLALPLPRQ